MEYSPCTLDEENNVDDPLRFETCSGVETECFAHGFYDNTKCRADEVCGVWLDSNEDPGN